jgi:hypothetical protein
MCLYPHLGFSFARRRISYCGSVAAAACPDAAVSKPTSSEPPPGANAAASLGHEETLPASPWQSSSRKRREMPGRNVESEGGRSGPAEYGARLERARTLPPTPANSGPLKLLGAVLEHCAQRACDPEVAEVSGLAAVGAPPLRLGEVTSSLQIEVPLALDSLVELRRSPWPRRDAPSETWTMPSGARSWSAKLEWRAGRRSSRSSRLGFVRLHLSGGGRELNPPEGRR